jgi:ABC-type Mn2+/Zn2+ transport system ATPase subunit
MALLQLRGAVKGFGARTILDGLELDIEPGVRVGLIGANGAGKSTVLRLVAGDEALDAGELTHRRGLVVSYLPQQVEGDQRGALTTVLAARPKQLVEEWAASGSPDVEWRVRALLFDVGLDDDDLEKPTRPASRTCCCSTSPRPTSTWPPANGSRR